MRLLMGYGYGVKSKVSTTLGTAYCNKLVVLICS